MSNNLLRTRALAAIATSGLLLVGCGGGGGSKGGSASIAVTNTSSVSSATNGNFSFVAPMSEARVHHTATLLASGQVFIAGGQNGGQTVSNTTEIFDPATGTVTKGPTLMSPRMHAAAVLLPTQKVLIVGGQADVSGVNALATSEIYDPITKTMSAGPTLSEARSCPAVAIYKDGSITKALVAGGASWKNGVPTSSKTADSILVDATPMTVTPLQALMAEDRYDAQAIAQANGQIMIQGGYTQLGQTGGPRAASSEVYDIKNQLFVPVTMLKARAENALTQAGANIYAIGGTDGSMPNGSVEMFNGAAWTQSAPLATARRGCTGTLVGSDIVVVGGLSTSALSSCELVATGNPSGLAAPSLGVARAYHTATPVALPGGQTSAQGVAVIGGTDGANIFSSIEVFAPNGASVPGATATNSGTSVPGSSQIIPPPPPPSTVNITSLSPTSGAIGQTVTISGTGFSAVLTDNVVRFNGVLATVTNVNVTVPTAMTLTVSVPAGATTGPVTITIGTSTSPQNPIFTVTGAAVATPRILFVLPNSGKHFFPVSITGQDFGQTPIATFNGVPSISIISLSTKSLPFIGSVSELVTLVPPGATTGPLTISNQGVVSNPVNFTVN